MHSVTQNLEVKIYVV